LTFTCPDVSHPGAFFWIRDSIIKYRQRDNLHRYNEKIVVLISEGTLSAAETKSIMFRTAINATLIGRPTPGANGNISRLRLPDEIIVCFSGVGAYYPDRTEIQRKGIIPDIEVYPDMQSILEGKDEILERAYLILMNYDDAKKEYT
jgi:C-terminal processing protease CtpA/Prc